MFQRTGNLADISIPSILVAPSNEFIWIPDGKKKWSDNINANELDKNYHDYMHGWVLIQRFTAYIVF